MIQGQRVRLRPKRIGDLVNDYAWRCDTGLALFDARLPLTTPFSDFLASYIQELNPSADSCRFAIETYEGKQIGNCMYFNLDQNMGQVEIGVMIGDRSYWNQGYGVEAINALLDHVFKSLSVTKVYLHTLNWNLRAQYCFAKCGFSPCGFILRDGHSFIRMEITHSRWQTHLDSKKES